MIRGRVIVKASHDPIIVQDFIRLHCFAWVVGHTSINPAGAMTESEMEV
jgi:hypothetical protein